MTVEEFKRKAESDPEWAPGWEIIDNEFDRLYPNQTPKHYATDMVSRAMFGGDNYLDGYSIYSSPKRYKHIVTYGMTELYANEKALGGEWNKWGYEMTIKLNEETEEDCMWAMDMLSNLARYTYTQKKFFQPYEYISGGGKSLHIGVESNITALLTISDTEAQTQDTLYGKTEFIQLVGITESELQALIKDRDNVYKLYNLIKQDNPDFVTDMKRSKSYI